MKPTNVLTSTNPETNEHRLAKWLAKMANAYKQHDAKKKPTRNTNLLEATY